MIVGVVVLGPTQLPLLTFMQAGTSTVGNCISAIQFFILRWSRSIASGFVMSRQERKTFIWIPSRKGRFWNVGKATSKTSRMAMMATMLKAKMTLRLVKGMGLAMDLPDLPLSTRWTEKGLKAIVIASEAMMTRAVVKPRKRKGISAKTELSL